MSTVPKTPPVKTPASAPIGSAIIGAAVAAIYAISPYATGATINWALIAALFLVTFGGSLALSLYHVQLPSPVQQTALDILTQLFTPLVARLQQPARVPAAPPAATAPVAAAEPPSVSTEVQTHV